MTTETALAPMVLEQRIITLRGQQVMLAADLAELYGVTTKRLNEQVRRNPGSFPADFMFRLTLQEVAALKPQNAASSWGGPRHALPYAFTQEGVSSLSSVLKSPRAVQVNVAIMRAFVQLRRLVLSNADLHKRLDRLEANYDGQFKIVFDAIRQLMALPIKKNRPIGFKEEPKP